MKDPYGIAAEHARRVADRITDVAKPNINEADFRREVDRALFKFAEAAKVEIGQKDEYVVASGRADTVYNKLVVEYKAPGILGDSNSSAGNTKAIAQITNYVRDVTAKEHRDISRMAGVILDGRFIIFLRFTETSHVVDRPLAVNASSVERFLKYLVSLSAGVAIIPENLIVDFGADNKRTQRIVRAFYETLGSSQHPLVKNLFRQWQAYFSEVAGYQVGSTQFAQTEEMKRLAKRVGVAPSHLDPARLLFSIHTYYALLMKLIAWLSVSPYLVAHGVDLGRLSGLDSKALRKEITRLESGTSLREFTGVQNFLEGDFFSWYERGWNDDIYKTIKEILSRLNDYDPTTLELNPEQTRDLMKKLYHLLLPREIRHDLGEYYTPDWLAHLTLNRLAGIGLPQEFELEGGQRILDPACGSGTFLVLAIQGVRQYCSDKKMTPEDTLECVLRSVVGADLNPLAVIAARTNYLLAIRDLLPKRKREISLPVYLADTVLTPAKSTEIADFGNYRIRTAVGTFEIPEAMAKSDRIEALADSLDADIENDSSPDVFLKHLRSSATMTQEEFGHSEPVLRHLYETIQKLHKEGLNGIWSRIIKNAFAPLFVGEFDFIGGNPPWINWESLPPDYRTDTTSLWQRYGLFPHSGIDTILGKGKKDLSILMTYAVMDRHLADKGRLGFVITQTLFKTSGAGQGFRNFLIPRGAHIGPVHVDDLVELNPFEGATNRTAVMVLQKGRAAKYPVNYTLWQRKKGGSRIGFEATLADVVELTTRERLQAAPIDAQDQTSAWMTLPAGVATTILKVRGISPYKGYEGSNTGGANGVFWIRIEETRPDGMLVVKNITEGAKRKVDEHIAAIEPDLVYPLLRGRDVQRWMAAPSCHLILAQDPKERRGIDPEKMQSDFIKTYSWLKSFEKPLRERAALKRYFSRLGKKKKLTETGPFYSMFGIGEYTLSKHKVVWREQSARITAAVVGSVGGKPVIPDHKLMFVPVETAREAHFICALLNSSPSEALISSYVVNTSVGTHVLDTVAIPEFDSKNDTHVAISEISQRAHNDGTLQAAGVQELDRLASRIWKLSPDDLRAIRSIN